MNSGRITRNIIKLRNLTLKACANIDPEFNKSNTYNHGVYSYIGSSAFFTLSIDRESNEEYDKSKSVTIHTNNKYVLLRQMKRLLDNIYGDDIFGVDSTGKVIIYSDGAKSHRELVRLPHTDNHNILFYPCIVSDENDILYEGVMVCLNNTNNIVKLNIDEFETLYNTIKDADIFLYTQALLNHALLMPEYRNGNNNRPQNNNRPNYNTRMRW